VQRERGAAPAWVERVRVQPERLDDAGTESAGAEVEERVHEGAQRRRDSGPSGRVLLARRDGREES
jgi:hypothetical protein